MQFDIHVSQFDCKVCFYTGPYVASIGAGGGGGGGWGEGNCPPPPPEGLTLSTYTCKSVSSPLLVGWIIELHSTAISIKSGCGHKSGHGPVKFFAVAPPPPPPLAEIASYGWPCYMGERCRNVCCKCKIRGAKC